MLLSTFTHTKYPNIKREDYHKTVVYIGVIIFCKGFLALCSICKRISEAKLLILGNRKLSKEAEFEKLGITSVKYKYSFVKLSKII